MGAHPTSAVEAVCVGETMVLLVPDPPVAPEHAATFRRDIGGAESNVAIHLARSGHRVAWHSALGDDAFGRYVRDRLEQEGVDCRARIVPSRPTGLYLKELAADGTRVRYYRQGAAASTLTPDDAAAVWERRPRLVHTTGITATLSQTSREMVEVLLTADRHGVTVAFDVNYRPALHADGSAGMLRAMARRADVVFCGLDEAYALWGCTSVEDVRDVLDGPEILVVKRGSDGVSVVRDGRSWDWPAPDVSVVESVGAGDAFAAGFLGGLLRGSSTEECLAAGTAWAGAVLQVYGDLPGRDDRIAGAVRP